jgi:hypothetical protein
LVFLIDFGLRLKRASSKRGYLIGGGGWLDLLGSIPSFGGALRFTALFRLARLSRLTRTTRLLRGQNKGQLVKDVLDNRSQYAVLVTVTLAMIVLMVASILELQFEVGAPGANITTGGTALWWGIVTITTVGYGDTFPVTAAGRVTGVFVMFAGVGDHRGPRQHPRQRVDPAAEGEPGRGRDRGHHARAGGDPRSTGRTAGSHGASRGQPRERPPLIGQVHCFASISRSRSP